MRMTMGSSSQWPFQEPTLEVPTICYSTSIIGSWNSHWSSEFLKCSPKYAPKQFHHQNIANIFWNKLYTLHTFTCSKPTVRLEWLEIDRTFWTRLRSNRRGFHLWKMHKSAGFSPFGAWNLHPRRQLDRVVHHIRCFSHHWPQLIADITHLLLLTSTT